MISENRRRGGALAQSAGKGFEGLFVKTCELSGISATKIPTGCKVVGRNSNGSPQLVMVKTPWDFVLSYQSRTALIDTKTVDEFAYPASKITEHQVDEMLSHERMGVIAGYIIWLRKAKVVFFMPAIGLYEYMQMGGSFDNTHPKAVSLGDEIFDIRKIFHTVHPMFWPKGIV